MTNQISVLAADRTETLITAQRATPSLWMRPLGSPLTAGGDSLLIVNHTLLTGNPAHFALLQAAVDEKGDELVKPLLP